MILKMRFFSSPRLFPLFLHFFFRISISLGKQESIRLEGNGYATVLVALHPRTPPHPELLSNLVRFIKAGSERLFAATRRRAFLRQVDVLVPSTWKPASVIKIEGVAVDFEPDADRRRFDDADVRVAPANPRRGDAPYVETFKSGGECGAFGDFLHLTPDFLTMKEKERGRKFGDGGKLFVHQWAHLRWGLKDEHPSMETPLDDDALYFSSVTKKYEATRCALDMIGRFVQRKPDETGWRECSVAADGKPEDEETCFFATGFDETEQPAGASLMYAPRMANLTKRFFFPIRSLLR